MANDPLISTGTSLARETRILGTKGALPQNPATSPKSKTQSCSLNPFQCLSSLFCFTKNKKAPSTSPDRVPLLEEKVSEQGLLNRLDDYADLVSECIGSGEQKELGTVVVNLSRLVRSAGKSQNNPDLINVADRLCNLGVNLFELAECPVCFEEPYNIHTERWMALTCCKNLICDFHVKDWIDKEHDDCTQCRKEGLAERTQSLLS